MVDTATDSPLAITIADSITLLRMNPDDPVLLAKRIDAGEKDSNSRSLLKRMQFVESSARSGVNKGIGKIDGASLTAFLASPMRSVVPKLDTPTQANAKRKAAADAKYATYLTGLAAPQVELDVGVKGSAITG